VVRSGSTSVWIYEKRHHGSVIRSDQCRAIRPRRKSSREGEKYYRVLALEFSLIYQTISTTNRETAGRNI